MKSSRPEKARSTGRLAVSPKRRCGTANKRNARRAIENRIVVLLRVRSKPNASGLSKFIFKLQSGILLEVKHPKMTCCSESVIIDTKAEVRAAGTRYHNLPDARLVQGAGPELIRQRQAGGSPRGRGQAPQGARTRSCASVREQHRADALRLTKDITDLGKSFCER